MPLLFRIVRNVAVLMTLVCGAFLVWALFVEESFLYYENLPFPAKLKQVHAGEAIPLVVRRCNKASTVRFYDVTHELHSASDRNSKPYVLHSERVTLPPGCHETVSLVNVIPPNTPAGIYIASGLGITEGSIRTFSIPWRSQPFEVTQ
jgi:uncharacterized lipoprotein YbaY